MSFRSTVRSARLRVLFGGFLVAGATVLLADEESATLLPAGDVMPGWVASEEPRTFSRNELFDLIDGGAELYHEYGFQQAASYRYENGASATLQIEIYRMTGAPSAYGVYSMMQSPKGTAVAIGQAARLFRDYLVFWKGTFFVSVTVTGTVADASRELTVAAQRIADSITATGQEPEALRLLPKEGLQDCKYFRGPVALSNLYVFGSGNLFGVTEGVCGFYPRFRLFILNYADEEQAIAHLAFAGQEVGKDTSYRGLVKNPDGFECVDGDQNRVTASREGNHITVRITPPVTAGSVAGASGASETGGR